MGPGLSDRCSMPFDDSRVYSRSLHEIGSLEIKRYVYWRSLRDFYSVSCERDVVVIYLKLLYFFFLETKIKMEFNNAYG